MSAPIYVELPIRAGIDELWRVTQTPAQHQRWDLRFTTITYVPRADPSTPQRFLYRTRIGFGLAIEGQGETVGDRTIEGDRTSALRFWSDDGRSLIQEGSGYWRYTETPDGVRFVTLYDYRTRFGLLGRLVDAVAFRPLLGWATAWSFDRLRLWLEEGIVPELSMRSALIHALSRLALAAIWLYHAVVPKLLYRESGELDLLAAAGLAPSYANAALSAIAAAELSNALALLFLWRWRPLLLLNAAVALVLPLGILFTQPAVLVEPFQPLTLGIAMAALAIAGFLSSATLPNAGRCDRSVRTAS